MFEQQAERSHITTWPSAVQGFRVIDVLQTESIDFLSYKTCLTLSVTK